MLNISYLFENARAGGKTTKAMIDHFNKRTRYHIDLVKKYLDKIINLKDSRLDNDILEKEKIEHDQSKFREPEFEPYLYVNWSYHMKDLGAEYIPSEDIKNQMQAATFHHVKINQHHPEAWDEKSTLESINNKDRDKPPEEIVDATNMPLSYVATMIADWLAMSEEKNTCPYEWTKNNIDKRWKFNKDQEKLIYDLIDKVWEKKK